MQKLERKTLFKGCTDQLPRVRRLKDRRSLQGEILAASGRDSVSQRILTFEKGTLDEAVTQSRSRQYQRDGDGYARDL